MEEQGSLWLKDNGSNHRTLRYEREKAVFLPLATSRLILPAADIAKLVPESKAEMKKPAEAEKEWRQGCMA